MKPTLPFLLSLLLFFTLYKADLKANPECDFRVEASECLSDNPLLANEDNPCYAPQWHNTYNISHNSATFQWDQVWGASYYTIQWRYPNGSWNSISANCYQTWYTMNNLNSCTSYEWRVRSHCGYGYASDWCYPTYFTTQCYSCHPPEWLQCYNITDHSATWSWSGVYGADYYAVQWRQSGGSWYDLHGGPFYGTWVNVNHLNPCTTYEYRVKSYCHYGGWSSWCYPYTFTTTCHSSCPVPTGLNTKDIGDTKATFKWSPVHGARSYTVQIRDHYGYWQDVPGSPTGGIWITAYHLTPCRTYEWRVKANCGYSSHGYSSHGYSSSNWSQPQTFTTTCGHGCYAPEWVFTNGITSSSALLHWGSVIGANAYVIEWRSAGGHWNVLLGGPWPNNVADLNGLQPHTFYEWRVKAICDGNASNWSSITHFTTSGSSCGMPFYRYTSPVSDSTATLNWSAVPGALDYTLQIRLINGTWADIPGSPTTGTSISVTGLLPNTMYEWRMQVNCGNAQGNWLSPVMFITGSSNGCATPGSLVADNITLSSALLTWAGVQGAETYSVEIRQMPHGAWAPVFGSPVDTNFIQVNGLDPHSTYEWRVRANCAGGQHSFWSVAFQFTTNDIPPCSAPVHLTTDSITETTANFYWAPVAGAQGYEVQVRLPNGLWVNVGVFTTDTFMLATGLTPHTSYEWRVRAKCNDLQFSHWSASAFFITSGTGITNDDCANATLLTVETSCVATFGSNVDATASNPPPVGGCSSAGYRDVWFRFAMPDVPNPTVTIRTSAGSLANAVMEVYAGTDCNLLSVITCEDNNDNGNGSTMPVVNLTGTPNANIWVRVWGFEGSTGTFTICVFDHISFNYVGLPNSYDFEEDESMVILPEATVESVKVNIEPEILVSPNPASDILKVDVLQTEDCQVMGIRLMDLSGKITLTQVHEPGEYDHFKSDIDVSNLVPGIYLLQVQTTCGLMTEKVSVIR